MKEQIALLNDSELILLANEMTLTSLPANAISRRFIPEGGTFALSMIEINCVLVQVLAERLVACSPHIVK